MAVSSGSELSAHAFQRLLEALDPDRETAAAEYEKLRFKIRKVLEWRGCLAPEEYADQVLDRLAARLAQGDKVDNCYAYCCGIARLLLMEGRRNERREAEAARVYHGSGREADSDAPMAVLLERCLDGLPQKTHELILAYYQREKRGKIDLRGELARELGIPLNALRLRVHRIRAALQRCVEQHVSEGRDTE